MNVNATTLRGSTPGSDRIDAIRCEMTWVFPEPGARDDLQRLVEAGDRFGLGGGVGRHALTARRSVTVIASRRCCEVTRLLRPFGDATLTESTLQEGSDKMLLRVGPPVFGCGHQWWVANFSGTGAATGR